MTRDILYGRLIPYSLRYLDHTVSTMSDNIERYGFTAMPRDPDSDILFLGHLTASGPNPTQASYKLSRLAFPDSALLRVQRVGKKSS